MTESKKLLTGKVILKKGFIGLKLGKVEFIQLMLLQVGFFLNVSPVRTVYHSEKFFIFGLKRGLHVIESDLSWLRNLGGFLFDLGVVDRLFLGSTDGDSCLGQTNYLVRMYIY